MLDDKLDEASWRFHWVVTESAGVKIHTADFRGHRVLWEASLPYVLVDHQRSAVSLEESDELEPHGPWWAPLGRRTLAGPVRKNTFRGGLELAADFHCGIYRYTQLWRFHSDGRFEPWLTIYGHGLHAAHTYHPHWRFDFDVDGALDDALEAWDGRRWTRVEHEGWLPYTGEASPQGHVWRQIDFGSGAAVNLRPHPWEDAELFAVRYHPTEWPPFTPRAAVGDQPFPAAYVGAEPLDGEDVTLWYVGHIHYDQSFPVTAGPWIEVEGL